MSLNKPVDFTTAKLLKEKEYKDKNILGTVRLSEPKYYDPNGIIHSIKDAFEEIDYKIEDCFNAPTIVSVVMWLYEKHGIWISVQPTSIVGKFQFRTYYNNKGVMNQHWNDSMGKEFNSPTEAYEAAIEYTLKNLI